MRLMVTLPFEESEAEQECRETFPAVDLVARSLVLSLGQRPPTGKGGDKKKKTPEARQGWGEMKLIHEPGEAVRFYSLPPCGGGRKKTLLPPRAKGNDRIAPSPLWGRV